MPFCIMNKKGSVWTTEMRFRPVHKMAAREHMLECRTESQAKTIADRRKGRVVPLDKDANPYVVADKL